MPELPEVETTRSALSKVLKGKKLSSMNVLDSRLRYPVPENLSQIITGAYLDRIDRHGKYLIFVFKKNQSKKNSMILHLGMSGRVVVNPKPDQRWAHIQFVFESIPVAYIDPRRFGFILLPVGDIEMKKALPAGVDAIAGTFNFGYLKNQIKNRTICVKDLIMNQSVVAGIGNIYASEILHAANIHPFTRSCDLQDPHLMRIITATRKVLKMAIQKKGTSMTDFYYGEGKKGQYQSFFRVYDRAGLPCQVCGELIQKTTSNKRATYFCPVCQKLE